MGNISEKTTLDEQTAQTLEYVLQRISYLEHRLLGMNRHRWDVLEKIADYFRGAQIEGDYAEFGVYQGETFAHACSVLALNNTKMQFWAYDSFEGLPKPKIGADLHEGYSGGFFEGQFQCSESTFIDYLKRQKIDLSKVHIVKGWYQDTLTENASVTDAPDKISLAWIDCDLYESTVPVLEFITDKISIGSVILFDDWRCFRNLAEHGQQRACREWLDKYPHIQLNLLIDNDYNGYAFSVARC